MTDIYIYICFVLFFLINRAGVQLKTCSQQHIAPVIVQYQFFFFTSGTICSGKYSRWFLRT